ncbi:MAG: retropepsin-like aspartic protease [Candidatus Poribacteria bacterium]
MGRIYEFVEVDGKRLNTLFDSGAVRTYITRKSAEKIGLKIERLKEAFEVGLGGRARKINECCLVQGNIKDNPFNLISWVVEELGQDEKGREIELLFGATDMQVWNIQIDLEKETLDLSRFRKEFIEYFDFAIVPHFLRMKIIIIKSNIQQW